MTWTPHVTVAAIAEQHKRFLIVEEKVRDRLVLNNPAGHLEAGESFTAAVRRETMEETGWEFEPDAVTGIYLWTNAAIHTTFLRITFCGRCLRQHPDHTLDTGIVAPRWMTREELGVTSVQLRSPLVLRCIDDYLGGRRYPLDLLASLDSSAGHAARQHG
ncbi:MAG: NUDIX hydrolase [Gammaproteobacteria bacterium]|nr:NUDIX hydrolase [Gammaproteobacteria bacterium]MDE2023909.1 NUDIX hydrolase [Gammaproteobacteria bacterium]MDE2139164.1 NUDIX hydrolase [Gammaproteobacteria bacterium]MDE2274128.1 NUDIX hydrolase [Gammaproteobacteria bacterium]